MDRSVISLKIMFEMKLNLMVEYVSPHETINFERV